MTSYEIKMFLVDCFFSTLILALIIAAIVVIAR